LQNCRIAEPQTSCNPVILQSTILLVFLTRSFWRKAIVTVVAAGILVVLYDATTEDARPADPNASPAPGDRISISATAYCKGSVTAAGVSVQDGAAASDRSLLPLGSIVSIETGDSRYDGIYTILDTGPEIKGREVDIYMWSCNEALAFGRKEVQLTLLRRGWDPKATPPPTTTWLQRIFRSRAAPESVPRPLQPPPLSRPLTPRSSLPSPQSETPPADAPQPEMPQRDGGPRETLPQTTP
jgi:3D (Asp-Asp-Asp) domain-containing protein